MNLVYVVKRFPKYSETFVLHEIQELRAQGDRVTVWSLRLAVRPGSRRRIYDRSACVGWLRTVFLHPSVAVWGGRADRLVFTQQTRTWRAAAREVVQAVERLR